MKNDLLTLREPRRPNEVQRTGNPTLPTPSAHQPCYRRLLHLKGKNTRLIDSWLMSLPLTRSKCRWSSHDQRSPEWNNIDFLTMRNQLISTRIGHYLKVRAPKSKGHWAIAKVVKWNATLATWKERQLIRVSAKLKKKAMLKKIA